MLIAFDMTPDWMIPSTSSSCEYCGIIGIDVPAAAEAANQQRDTATPNRQQTERERSRFGDGRDGEGGYLDCVPSAEHLRDAGDVAQPGGNRGTRKRVGDRISAGIKKDGEGVRTVRHRKGLVGVKRKKCRSRSERHVVDFY